MSYNVMNEYIKLTQKNIIDYMKFILENKFERIIIKEFIEAYMEIRYYDLNESKKNKILKNDILENLEIKERKLIEEYPEKEEIIKNTEQIFKNILYLDNVIPYKNTQRVIDHIEEQRKKMFNKYDEMFKGEFHNKVEENIEERKEFLEKFESKEFYLKISNYEEQLGIYRVNLKYDFKISLIYSNFAIEKAFNSGITNEDKLFVEYYLISAHIVDDIIRGNFKKQYIVEFSETLLAKVQKLERLLNIINNSAIQDKLCLKIKYNTFENNKEIIQKMMKRGFRFAVILDDTFDLKYEPIEKLEMFKYVLLNKDYKYYYELLDSKKITNQIIKI